MNGLVAWRGPSPVDGAPLFMALTGITRRSNNPGTGDMLQTWIYREDISPPAARDRGLDRSCCGDCAFRFPPKRADGTEGKLAPCYVNLYQAPLATWRTYRGLPVAKPAELRAAVAGRYVRLGAYGDPAMVPVPVLRSIVEPSAGWTGYTHQWSEPWARRKRSALQRLLVASTESAEQTADAWSTGWRTYRARQLDSAPARGEVDCPKGTGQAVCADCRLCAGSDQVAGKVPSVSIPFHGDAVKIRMAGSVVS